MSQPQVSKNQMDSKKWKLKHVGTPYAKPQAVKDSQNRLIATQRFLERKQKREVKEAEARKNFKGSEITRDVKVEAEDSEDPEIQNAPIREQEKAPASSETTQSPPSFNLNTEIEYCKAQCNRIVQERPESAKLLREMLLETIVAFDKNDFGNDLGQFYRKLAKKHGM